MRLINCLRDPLWINSSPEPNYNITDKSFKLESGEGVEVIPNGDIYLISYDSTKRVRRGDRFRVPEDVPENIAIGELVYSDIKFYNDCYKMCDYHVGMSYRIPERIYYGYLLITYISIIIMLIVAGTILYLNIQLFILKK